ncbi:type II/IV secretion system ATPase subunit [Candidatus Woesearchaeota archaeon]|nr:type II/IV secretion system ATPase subunit [Candidatus Woesearchaeota archaeon]
MPEISNNQKKEYEVVREGQEDILKINASNWPYSPSIEDNPVVMSKVIEKLFEFPSTARLILVQNRNYEYNYEQTQALVEIANLYKHLTKQKKVLTLKTSDVSSESFRNKVLSLQYLVYTLLKTDPLGCYVESKRLSRESKVFMGNITSQNALLEEQDYFSKLEYISRVIEKTSLIRSFKEQLSGYEIGDRSLYKEFFNPNISPIFLFTKIYSQIPESSKQLDSYNVKNMNVSIFQLKDDVKNFYRLIPPELKLTEDQYEILNIARKVLGEHKPKDEEFLEPQKLRRTFFNIGRDLLLDLLNNKNIIMPLEEINELAKILVRYTIGFGAIELLLQDKKIQDIVVNSPIGQTPIFIVHEDYEECVTNIIPSSEDAESWATKFRLLSGRPLDEANPVLDTSLSIPGARARVAVISEPLSRLGLAYAFRRHRDTPWTLPLFIKNKMINSLGAGLLSFFFDSGKSVIFAGTRSSGKTSLLGASLLEILKKYRILVIEDTEEINVDVMREIGYNIQSMKVRSALSKSSTEVPADEGIRTALRLGDSALIVGEVRSSEALSLYEAMRVGSAANVVAGTIHGDSPYGVFDRVVNDLKVPKTSFKATDIIVISNPIKSPDGLHKLKRVLSITEVRKHWEKDPLAEKGFVELMKYNPETDQLEPTEDLINGDSEVLKSVAAQTKEWASDWNALWENIILRSKINQALVDYSEKFSKPALLEAKFKVSSNDALHKIIYQEKKEDTIDNQKVYATWEKWLKDEIEHARY